MRSIRKLFIGVGDHSVGKHETVSLDAQHPIKTKCDGIWLKSQHWCERDRKILRIQWPGSLAKTVSPSFMERL